MNQQTRPIPRCTPEVEITRRALERRALRQEVSILPSTNGMIKMALVGLVVAVLGYITYKIIKGKDNGKG